MQKSGQKREVVVKEKARVRAAGFAYAFTKTAIHSFIKNGVLYEHIRHIGFNVPEHLRFPPLLILTKLVFEILRKHVNDGRTQNDARFDSAQKIFYAAEYAVARLACR